MSYRITVIDSAADEPRTYIAIGDRDTLMDVEYDRGALGVTLMVSK